MQNLEVRMSADGRHAKLLSPFTVSGNGYKIVVPAGFETDFASIPRLFWRICPPWDRHMRAAVVHDYLYSFGEARGLPDDSHISGCSFGRVSRKKADWIFLDLMRRLKVPLWKRSAIWAAVRAFARNRFGK